MIKFRKSILIISAAKDGYLSTQSYLRSQGWVVNCKNDLKEALQFLMTDSPEIVLVCMDHPNRNVSLLPKLILERIHCCVIATTQQSTVENNRVLQKVNCEYKLFPPSSGRAIEKVFKKYTAKMSTLSPKLFELNLSQEKSESSLDYANWASKSKLELQSGFGDRVSSEHLLIRGTERIISEIIETENAKHPTPDAIQPIQQISQITCMLIESIHFQGYLVAAMAKNYPLDANFHALIKKNLLQFLRDQGEAKSVIETFNMNIKPVAFLGWASDYADFLRQSVLKDNELAFAFFPLEGVRASYKMSDIGGMLSVPIEELFGDSEVGFDLHLSLPTNKKYVLYTPKGSVFYTHQKARLTDRGIEHLHIHSNDLAELNRYRAQKYFNTIVDEYISTNLY